jgi:DNA-binding LacI/PurR family transcriptional regulator
MVKAVILAGANFPNLLELLNHKGITHVALGNNIMGEPGDLKSDVVFYDDIQGAKDTTQYLIGLGHRRICFVGDTSLPWFARCYEGYRQTMVEAGLAPRHIDIHSEDEQVIGYLGAKSLLAGNEHITAFFAGSDPTACGVYKALIECGLRVPRDISVVSCNDTVGEWTYPGLTTIREFPEEIGRYLAEAALNRVVAPGQRLQCVTIPTELIKRDSCQSII